MKCEKEILDSLEYFPATGIRNAIRELLFLNFVKMTFQKIVKAYCFENVHWSTQIKTIAGKYCEFVGVCLAMYA